jgi:hypothetical protein
MGSTDGIPMDLVCLAEDRFGLLLKYLGLSMYMQFHEKSAKKIKDQ